MRSCEAFTDHHDDSTAAAAAANMLPEENPHVVVSGTIISKEARKLNQEEINDGLRLVVASEWMEQSSRVNH